MMKSPISEFTVFAKQQVAGNLAQVGWRTMSTGYQQVVYDPLRNINWALILAAHSVGMRAAAKIMEDCGTPPSELSADETTAV